MDSNKVVQSQPGIPQLKSRSSNSLILLKLKPKNYKIGLPNLYDFQTSSAVPFLAETSHRVSLTLDTKRGRPFPPKSLSTRNNSPDMRYDQNTTYLPLPRVRQNITAETSTFCPVNEGRSFVYSFNFISSSPLRHQNRRDMT